MKPVISNVIPEPFDVSTKTLDVYLPHHITVTIRERNGEDEGILTSSEDFQSGKAIAKFLSSVIVGPKKYTWEEIQRWPLRSKNYLMYKERMAYYGSLVTWDQQFQDTNGNPFKLPWEEDIAWFDRDLQNDNGDFKKGQIIAYPKDKPKMEIRTASGKNFRMDYFTGEMEAMTLALSLNELNVNTRLLLRNLEVQDTAGNWHRIQNFKHQSPRDLGELRNYIEKEDFGFDMVYELVNPKTKEIVPVTLLLIPSFFYQ